ncbi:MAG: response regulator [Symploca sp. SIO2B6]|nr:response regulator [Symploca sp. SIO2B6]
MRILLVEDDESLIDLLKNSLAKQNYVVDAVTDGEQGWVYGSTYTYDLILLDLLLPKVDGISLCQRFRASGYHLPILLLTSRHASTDKIRGLDAGADDYLTKPFDFEELAARMRALLRRVNSNSLPILIWGSLQLDPRSCEVSYNTQLLSLTSKEYALLELFLRHSQHVFSISAIIENLWSSAEFPAEATVRSHLRRLRRKLTAVGAPDDLIETVHGLGYRLKLHSNDADSETSTVIQPEFTASKHSRHFEALAAAWEKYREKSRNQLASLEQAARDLKQGSLSLSHQEQARLAAHSLAGNLGIFGFDEGSRLARELEEILQANTHALIQQVFHFEALLMALRNELAQENITGQVPRQFSRHSPLLLIIGEDSQFTQQLAAAATSKGIRSVIALTIREARAWIFPEESMAQDKRYQPPNVVLIKLSFTESTQPTQNRMVLSEHLSLIAELKVRTSSLPVLLIADQDHFTQRLEVARRGGWFFLKQPIAPAQVMTIVSQALKHSYVQEKVMILDDDLELLKVMPSLLQPWGFKLTTLDDPRQFWDVLEAVTPNLLVLDVEMPHFSGIELCQVLRTHPYWCRLPVLFLSAHTDAKTQNQVFANGADDFVSKPFVATELANRILNRLERVRLRAGATV